MGYFNGRGVYIYIKGTRTRTQHGCVSKVQGNVSGRPFRTKYICHLHEGRIKDFHPRYLMKRKNLMFGQKVQLLHFATGDDMGGGLHMMGGDIHGGGWVTHQ